MSFANSIVRPSPAPVSQQVLPAPVSQQGKSDTLGIGGIFSQMNQGFQNQMGMMRSQPLNVYRNYLQETYVSPEAQQVDEFVGLVDQAERAHFGAEESFGFGGGPMAQSYMQKMPEPYQQQPQQFSQSVDKPQLFAEGGAVSSIPDEALSAMREKVINDYGFDPVNVATEEGVDPELFLRVMWTENKGRQGPVSEAGAIGLMQLMPGTAEELGVNPNDPLQNARGGARYLRQQLRTFRSVPLALAAYNAGPGNVQKYNGVPPFEETRNYVAQIQGVDTGEILPEMDQFYTFADKKPPAMMPQPRPEGLGTPEYVPPAPVQSEYLTTGVRSLFAPSFSPPPQRAPRSRQPAIPDIMGQPSQMPDEDDTAMGIEYYRQFAALPNRNLG